MEILCTLAVRGAFDAKIAAAFERAVGRVEIAWAPTTILAERIRAGERADLTILIDGPLEKLAREGILDPSSVRPVAESRIGLAVSAGAAHPAIGTLEELAATLLAARSVAYSKSGASGIFFEALLARLGIDQRVRARATAIPEGFTAEKLISGEADVAIQQVSELKVVPGIEIVGQLPEEAQTITRFSAAAFAANEADSRARGLIDILQTPEATSALLESGLDLPPPPPERPRPNH
jgi:molybdate transport system substrate-binding protein